MCLRACACVCGDSRSIVNQKVGRPAGEGGISFRTTPDRRGRGGLKISILAGRPL